MATKKASTATPAKKRSPRKKSTRKQKVLPCIFEEKPSGEDMTLMEQTIRKVARRLSSTPEAVENCIKALDIPLTDKGLEKIQSEDFSRDSLIRHFRNWVWPTGAPTQAQILGAVVIFKTATENDRILRSQFGEISSDEIEALSTCWEGSDLGEDMRRRMGLIDATMIKPHKTTPLEETDKDFNEARREELKDRQKPSDMEHVAFVGNRGGKALKIEKKLDGSVTKEWVDRTLPEPQYLSEKVEISSITKYLRRINAASVTLQEKPEELQYLVETVAKPLSMLDSPDVTVENLLRVICKSPKTNNAMKIMKAALQLKGQSLPEISTDKVDELLRRRDEKQVSPPISLELPEQMDDRALIERYNEKREQEVSWELERRAKGQPFIVLSPEGERGTENLNIETTFQLLRTSRKRVNPEVLDVGVQVYRVRDIDRNNRTVDLCNECGDILYKGWCATCREYVGNAKRQIMPRPHRLPSNPKKAEVAVQVNGRIKGSFSTIPGANVDLLESEAKKALFGQGFNESQVKKVVVIPDKLVNFIIA